jgi:hypothetical protein
MYLLLWRTRALVVLFTLESAQAVNIFTYIALENMRRTRRYGLLAVSFFLVVSAVGCLLADERIQKLVSTIPLGDDAAQRRHQLVSFRAMSITLPLGWCVAFAVLSLLTLALVAALT